VGRHAVAVSTRSLRSLLHHRTPTRSLASLPDQRRGAPYARTVEILLWLVPSLLVTCAAMAWVSWLGREGRGQVDRDVAVERLARALAKEHPTARRATPARLRDRSTGIAVRPTARTVRDGPTRRAS